MERFINQNVNDQPLIPRQLNRVLKKPLVKQGAVSAAFDAQEFDQDDPPHHLHKAVANLNQKLAENAAQSPHFWLMLAAISLHNLTIFAALFAFLRKCGNPQFAIFDRT